MGRSPWGSVRKLPSGRFQARCCIDLVWHGAPTTFRTKREADAYLASVRSDVDRGSWIDPDAGKVTFGEYSSRWLAERPQLRPRTRELYEGELLCTSCRRSAGRNFARSRRAGSARGAPT